MSKKIMGITMLLILIVISVLTGCDSIQSEVRWDTYENRFIQMEYPAEWTLEEVDSEVMQAVRFIDQGEEFVFEMSIAPIENWLEEEEKLKMMESLAIEQSEQEGFEILEHEEIEIDGYPGIRIVDQLENRGTRQTVAAVFYYHQLAVNFAGTDESYNEQEEVINRMINSIEVILN